MPSCRPAVSNDRWRSANIVKFGSGGGRRRSTVSAADSSSVGSHGPDETAGSCQWWMTASE